MGILATILGVVFILAGGMKIAQSKDKLAASGMGWVEDFPAQQVQMIGAAEVLGGLGLIIPYWTLILPFLSTIAAICLAILMGGAVYTHYRRNELPMAVPGLVLGILSIVVAVSL
ncbi:MAG: DoxX family protein [Candidatus Promineifilaceae bacterium]